MIMELKGGYVLLIGYAILCSKNLGYATFLKIMRILF